MQVFPSKVDLWLVVVLAAAPLAVVVSAAAVALNGDWLGAGVGALPLVFILGLYGGLLYPLRYEVHETELVVRFGLVRNRIPIANIVQVKKSRNPLSSPALSLDRIRIDRTGGNFLLISPKDKAAFARALQARNPLIHVDENVLRG